MFFGSSIVHCRGWLPPNHEPSQVVNFLKKSLDSNFTFSTSFILFPLPQTTMPGCPPSAWRPTDASHDNDCEMIDCVIKFGNKKLYFYLIWKWQNLNILIFRTEFIRTNHSSWAEGSSGFVKLISSLKESSWLHLSHPNNHSNYMWLQSDIFFVQTKSSG